MQLHWSYNAGLDNAPATPGVRSPPARPRCSAAGPPGAAAHTPAHLIKISAAADGAFTIWNTRTGFSKTYRPRE